MKFETTKAGIVLLMMVWVSCATAQAPTYKKDYEVAVYYFPNYHPDSINARWHGKGWKRVFCRRLTVTV